MDLKKESLVYHSTGQPGKTAIVTTKPCRTARDLSLAYTPGVAEPVLKIADNSDDAYRYTNRSNLVAVVSNGSAILGLGNRGALASKPVMEGKAVLFKRFADVDVFDIEVDTEDPDKLIEVVKLIEPTFGGINLEDIKAPDCFRIESELKELTNIPIFHDDQHGTAIIAGAGLMNALEINGKNIADIQVVFNGAGAAGISCARLFVEMGVSKHNLILCDSKGVIYRGRPGNLNPEKMEFVADTDARTLEDAMKGADVFMGVSVKNAVTPQMVKSMSRDPIIFAMANPDPEISYDVAVEARPDVIMATGRSDFPNQINNVLGFPFIFRGALDVRATDITENMKIAASKALASLAKEPVLDIVKKAYNNSHFSFGPKYIVPKPFDPRVIEWEAVAVARQAVKDGVARVPITDWEAYVLQLRKRMEKYWV
ncbi:malic enzyme-like NAD(P)-binding protein [Marispirochaeta aestuarii]|uniref:malic enzyme-like NAD(P)-binding protein n=1 Tax=Marispirochaeta aestuarii TaxID=1963862 RepID=UPI0029C64950|nr:malic enzyme-like NAD(P)-binding protein [Marispirochaeta aestuarii]